MREARHEVQAGQAAGDMRGVVAGADHDEIVPRDLLAVDPVAVERASHVVAIDKADARLDAATMMMVLHHVPEPERALAEVARVLAPGGLLILVDMLPHDREEYKQQMGHVWLGFSDDHLRRLLRLAGLGATITGALSEEGLDHYAVGMKDPEGNEFDIN